MRQFYLLYPTPEKIQTATGKSEIRQSTIDEFNRRSSKKSSRAIEQLGNIAREHWMQPDEHSPVGLILCTDKDDALARSAMEGLGSKLLVREYLTALPKESVLSEEVAQTRELLERQAELSRMARGKSR